MGQISRKDLDSLKHADYDAARKELMELKGVGDKVADCVMLYSLGFMDAFPIDRWVSRAMQERYIRAGASNYGKISAHARSYFGQYAGYAQQFLFNYVRK